MTRIARQGTATTALSTSSVLVSQRDPRRRRSGGPKNAQGTATTALSTSSVLVSQHDRHRVRNSGPKNAGGLKRSLQQHLFDDFGRFRELESFAGPVVHFPLNIVEVFLAEHGQVGALREVLAE